MAYVKTVWTNGSTALSAEHMNNIEDGIAALESSMNSSVTSLEGDVTSLEGRATSLEGRATSLESGKVDKVTGKGLSTNDYTTEEKTKLSSLFPIEIAQITVSVEETIAAKTMGKVYVPLGLTSWGDDQKYLGLREFEATKQIGQSTYNACTLCVCGYNIVYKDGEATLQFRLYNYSDSAEDITDVRITIVKKV